jgi:hypothetical protein
MRSQLSHHPHKFDDGFPVDRAGERREWLRDGFDCLYRIASANAAIGLLLKNITFPDAIVTLCQILEPRFLTLVIVYPVE